MYIYMYNRFYMMQKIYDISLVVHSTRHSALVCLRTNILKTLTWKRPPGTRDLEPFLVGSSICAAKPNHLILH